MESKWKPASVKPKKSGFYITKNVDCPLVDSVGLAFFQEESVLGWMIYGRPGHVDKWMEVPPEEE